MSKQRTFSVHHPLVRLIGRPVHKLEYDPVTQFKFNFFFTWLWFLAMIAVPFFPSLYTHALYALILQELSLWALFISHFTALGGAIAGIFAANRENEVPSLKAFKGVQPPTHQDIIEEIREDRPPFDA